MLSNLIYSSLFLAVLFSCKHKTSEHTEAQDRLTQAEIDTSVTYNKKTTNDRVSFKNVQAVVQNEGHNAWVNSKDSSASLALHFNLLYKDTLCVAYSPECWLMYPYEVRSGMIIVYWDDFIDSKYEFDIVKAVNGVNKKYRGQPFMILGLLNDTTLKASYPIPALIEQINGASNKRTFFPDKFIVKQEFYM